MQSNGELIARFSKTVAEWTITFANGVVIAAIFGGVYVKTGNNFAYIAMYVVMFALVLFSSLPMYYMWRPVSRLHSMNIYLKIAIGLPLLIIWAALSLAIGLQTANIVAILIGSA